MNDFCIGTGNGGFYSNDWNLGPGVDRRPLRQRYPSVYDELDEQAARRLNDEENHPSEDR